MSQKKKKKHQIYTSSGSINFGQCRTLLVPKTSLAGAKESSLLGLAWRETVVRYRLMMVPSRLYNAQVDSTECISTRKLRKTKCVAREIASQSIRAASIILWVLSGYSSMEQQPDLASIHGNAIINAYDKDLTTHITNIASTFKTVHSKSPKIPAKLRLRMRSSYCFLGPHHHRCGCHSF